ncbi:MAG TPA: serine hydrolase [Pyrinomonadaceae bacterium]|nr:serine hydrolase [Pyrinomonadaceae bacterium]
MKFKSSFVGIAAFVLFVVVGVVAVRLFRGRPAAREEARAVASHASQAGAANDERARADEQADAELAARLRAICERAGGEPGVAVVHVETRRAVEVGGAKPLPMFSVFKLPLAVAVLKEAEEGRLRLDEKLLIRPEDAAPGWRGNSELWRNPVELTPTELLEVSIIRSDNTSSDKLLELVGGPEVVTRRMRELALRNIVVNASVREFSGKREHPNTGTASDLAELLARLQRGEVLGPAQFALLRGFMERATTGLKRLRGDLPPGTVVADKTGSGETATNDVGLITLPEGRGHLAMAVLLSGSKLSVEAQEKLTAELARAAYDSYVARPAPTRR